jgi:curved DNA-binding protein CbpA
MENIDFNIIKYNLYEILSIPFTEDITKIKKQYIKTVKVFHPDKNSDLEQDIYYHIILAGKILTDSKLKNKYDNFIQNNNKLHFELKDNFVKNVKDVNIPIKSKNFNNLNEEFNYKHGYNSVKNDKDIIKKYNTLKNRNININYDKNTNNIIESTEIIHNPEELSNYIIGENFVSIYDIDKLYVIDSIESSKFTSLDKAFKIYKNIDYIEDNIPLIDKIKEYKNIY